MICKYLIVIACLLFSCSIIQLKAQSIDEYDELNVIFPYQPFAIDDDSVNEWFDFLFANLRQVIANTELDPLELPSDQDTFEATLFNKTMNGSIFVGDGGVSGLTTIHRSGNMSLEYQSNETEVIAKGAIGLIDLTATYSTKFELGPFRHHFGVTIKISYASIDFESDIFVYPDATVIPLAECSIAELNGVHLHLSGMGLFDNHILNDLANALLDLLEPVLANAISEVVCNLLEQALNGGVEP